MCSLLVKRLSLAILIVLPLRATAAGVFLPARNQITGTIHDSLRSLRKLKRLSLGGNPMHGTIPSWLGELTGLRALLLGAMTRELLNWQCSLGNTQQLGW